MKIKELKCPTCGANLVPSSPSDKVIMCLFVPFCPVEMRAAVEITGKDYGFISA